MSTSLGPEPGTRLFDRPTMEPPVERRELIRMALAGVAGLLLFCLGWALGRNSLLEQTYVRNGMMSGTAAPPTVEIPRAPVAVPQRTE